MDIIDLYQFDINNLLLRQRGLYYIRQMGQQDSRPETGDAGKSLTSSTHSQQSSNHTDSRMRTARFECSGVLRLQTTPFKNSIQIEADNETLFLQNVQTTLRQLLQDRWHTNRLFLLQEIERLIETITFTLAQLQERQITYKDINASHIFYDNDGNFKLMPNELIEASTYQQFRQRGEALPSPELIIALRCGQQDIVDVDILQKSNVFSLGMVLLQVATLLPSSQCYQSQTKDILDFVISERIVLVEQYYGEKIARIIANMLDYDYSQRMDIKQMSIWINRQMTSSVKNQSERTSMRNDSAKYQKARDDRDNSRVRAVKDNSVYMRSAISEKERQQNSSLYIIDQHSHHSHCVDKKSSRPYLVSKKDISAPAPKYDYKFDSETIGHGNYPNFEDNKWFRLKQAAGKGHGYQFCEDYRLDVSNKSYFDRAPTKQTVNYSQKQIQEREGERMVLKQVFTKQPDPSNFVREKCMPVETTKPKRDNASLNRIRQEIMKQRELLQELRRREQA